MCNELTTNPAEVKMEKGETFYMNGELYCITETLIGQGHGKPQLKFELAYGNGEDKHYLNQEDFFEMLKAFYDSGFYSPGDHLQIWVNQGARDAEVLASSGEKILVEYTMPNGTTALRIGPNVANFDGVSISYKNVTAAWKHFMRKAGMEWKGHSQVGHVPFEA